MFWTHGSFFVESYILIHLFVCDGGFGGFSSVCDGGFGGFWNSTHSWQKRGPEMNRTWPEMFQRQVWVRLSVTRGRARCHGRFGPPIVPCAPPSGPLGAHTRQRGGGRARALLKLQNSIVSGNCPFCPIYSTIGIHPAMKGYWPIIKIWIRH
jgi:hypothetical protein